jgi:hypothetical protein
MTTYPTGVKQNYAAPGNPPNLQPVPQTSWKWFAPLAEAEQGLAMIRELATDAVMEIARAG